MPFDRLRMNGSDVEVPLTEAYPVSRANSSALTLIRSLMPRTPFMGILKASSIIPELHFAALNKIIRPGLPFGHDDHLVCGVDQLGSELGSLL